ncbi:D-alanine--D-alanine ligase [Roseibacillus ishigakijimensis]|uniref:D-alanine--D-alanine ligase n=1 Tax=Roseibacillus ishigakijimensis TaxID=454146 RepID=A0A934RNU4_9BACT|nr:D-alanine--D-alanine ligase [Roseibacillus ishigakijimensis]MBK1832811.1 D-alanine--D-alanine ligase [Roseibacillus ishigakijimensis]
MDESILIAVLMGGPGSEREVSLASGRAVLQALQEEGLQAVAVEVTDTRPEIPAGTGLVFNVIHGTFGEDGQLQAYLEERGIPYTGAGVEDSRVAFDKALSKEVFLAKGVPTPQSEVLDVSAGACLPTIPVPFVVKPPREGSSVGIEIVKDPEQALAAIERGAKFSNDLLIEQFVSGRELTVGILADEALPVVEIIPPEGGSYDFATKYTWLSGQKNGSNYLCPAELREEEVAAVQAAALQAHQSLGIEVYSRVDVLLDSLGNPYVLEANTIPGMTASSLLPMGAKAAGYTFGGLCRRIAELSWQKRGSHS